MCSRELLRSSDNAYDDMEVEEFKMSQSVSKLLGSSEFQSLAKIMEELKAQPNFKKTRPEVHRAPELVRKSENLKDNFV